MLSGDLAQPATKKAAIIMAAIGNFMVPVRSF
jgi:hypothetical protein